MPFHGDTRHALMVAPMSELPPPPPLNLTPPPGYVAYGGTGAVPYGTQPIARISKVLGVLVLILVPVQLLSLLVSVQITSKAQDYLDGNISGDEFEDSYSGGLGQLGGLLVIPVAVLTMIWMFRMAKNLRVLGRTDATFGPGWGIGGWFTPPFVLYVVPWLMMRELWKGSDPESPAGDQYWKGGRVAPIINVWWVLYGLVPLVGAITSAGLSASFKDLDARDRAEQFDKFAAVNVALGLIGIATVVVYWMVVRQLSTRHMKAIGET